MKNGLPYYKAFPRDFIEGTIGMPFEIKCAYRVILDLIYMQGGRLPDDARYISGLLGCSVRKWNGIREALLDAGKINVIGEFLTNDRADKELESLRKLQDNQSEKASKPRKNKGLRKPQLSQPEPEPDIREDTNVSLSSGDDHKPIDEVAEAVHAYRTAAEAKGWPIPSKIDATRRRSISARLSDAGGVGGWRIAIEKAAASEFLGQARPFSGFGIDWITKPANFKKIMEGNYDDSQSGRPASRPSRADTNADTLRYALNVAGRARPSPEPGWL